MEVEEGQEPESFWRTVGGKKSSYTSLLKGEGLLFMVYISVWLFLCLFTSPSFNPKVRLSFVCLV